MEMPAAVWEASFTLRVSPQHSKREYTVNDIRGFAQGLTDRLVLDDGQALENTRLLRNKLEELAALQQARARCRRSSRRFKALSKSIKALHRKVAKQRKDELHKLSTHLATTCKLLATKELNWANRTRAPKAKPELDAQGSLTGHFLLNGAAAKAGLNRELLSSGMGFFIQQLSYKVEVTGTRWHVADTRKLKPTQRCACCAHAVKKHLDERMHLCTKCGLCTTRDRNSALVCLINALMPTFYVRVQKKQCFCDNGYLDFTRNRIAYANVSPEKMI